MEQHLDQPGAAEVVEREHAAVEGADESFLRLVGEADAHRDATRAQWAASSAGPAAASDADTSLMRSWIGESMAAWKYVTGVSRSPSGRVVGSVRSR